MIFSESGSQEFGFAALFWFLVSNWCNIRNKFPCQPLLRRLLLN